jgi:D-glycero-D-manno-heptose 1,7-bisphosphate phosphatase
MILKAAKRHGIDLSTAWMIGDSAKDVACGLKAGCGGTILVRTGNGLEAQKIMKVNGLVPDHVAANLAGATGYILKRYGGYA